MLPAEHFEEFRRRLLRTFPPEPFHGLISTHAECDDGIYLRTELTGKCWTELPEDVLFHGSIGLPLLEPAAVVAFLPAWLLRALEIFDPESYVLDFTLYFICPGRPEEDDGQKAVWSEDGVAEMVTWFDAEQRIVVGEWLSVIANSPEMKHQRPYAERGLKWWKA